MKKNKFMRLAALLLVLTMVSTCAISGTYAKYVTKGTGMDKARVAKWGVEVAVAGNMFAKTYDRDDTTFVADGKTVVSTENVIAPGTDGSMAAISLTGTPEVAVRVSYEMDIAFTGSWVGNDGTTVYCPIVVYINGAGYSMAGLGVTTVAAFEAKLEEIVAAYSKDYPAGTNLAGLSAEYLKISWEWPFNTSDANDLNDTALGNQAAAGNPAGMEVHVTCIVTQVD